MSRIFGIWNFDGAEPDRQLLSRMSDTLAHPGSEAASVVGVGAIGIGCRLFRVTPESAAESQPVASRSGAVLVFDGRLDNRTELIARLRHCQQFSATITDPE